jgi:ammonium transporter, Amt family
VFGLHGVAGLLGTLLTGVFQTTGKPPLHQLGVQALGAGAVILYVGLATWLIAAALKTTWGLRVKDAGEREGLDIAQHGESLAS